MLLVQNTDACDAKVLKKTNFSELFETIETDSDGYEKCRDALGKKLVLLYETGDGAPIQLDERAQMHLGILRSLKDGILPIVRPSSDSIETRIKELDGYDVWVQSFLDS